MVLNAAKSPASATPTMTMNTISSTSVTPRARLRRVAHIAGFSFDRSGFGRWRRIAACHRKGAAHGGLAERAVGKARARQPDAAVADRESVCARRLVHRRAG